MLGANGVRLGATANAELWRRSEANQTFIMNRETRSSTRIAPSTTTPALTAATATDSIRALEEFFVN